MERVRCIDRVDEILQHHAEAFVVGPKQAHPFSGLVAELSNGAETGQHGTAITGEQNCGLVHVPMREARRVHSIKAHGDGCKEGHDLTGRQDRMVDQIPGQ